MWLQSVQTALRRNHEAQHIWLYKNIMPVLREKVKVHFQVKVASWKKAYFLNARSLPVSSKLREKAEEMKQFVARQLEKGRERNVKEKYRLTSLQEGWRRFFVWIDNNLNKITKALYMYV